MTHRILLSTSLRSGRRASGWGEESSGALLLGSVDPATLTFQVERSIPVPASRHRARRRAVRGICAFGDGWAVANATEVFLYDLQLKRIEAAFSSRWLGDLHTFSTDGENLYLTATAADTVVGIDRRFQPVFQWWAGDEPELRRYLHPHHLENHHRAHRGEHDFRPLNPQRERFQLNHTFLTPAGDLVVNLPDLDPKDEAEPGLSKFWNITRRRFHFPALPHPVWGRIHDGIPVGTYHYLGWTERGRFLQLNRTGAVMAEVDCSVPLGDTTGHPVAKNHGWLRGATHLVDEAQIRPAPGATHLPERSGIDRFLVGQSQLTLFLVEFGGAAGPQRRGPLTVLGLDAEFAAQRQDVGLAVYCIVAMPAE